MSGNRTLIAAVVMMLLGLGLVLYSPPEATYNNPSNAPQMLNAVGFLTITLGVAVFFLRLGQRKSTDRILEAISRIRNQ